jgi:hypothetical protein
VIGGLEVVDSLDLEQTISAFAINAKSSHIAIATKSFVAVYKVISNEEEEGSQGNAGFQRLGVLAYAQSVVIDPGDFVVKIHFTACQCGVILSFDSGLKKKLCLSMIDAGLIDLCDTCDDELDALELNR